METIPIKIGPKTRYIISTSGRLSSLQRYQRLLQEILQINVAYIPIDAGNGNDHIDPQKYANILRSMNCIGGAISKDIKQAIIPFLDEIDISAKEVNSVNTVIVKDDKLKGYNTDALGFEAAIVKGMKESGITVKTAVCYGYGGVASVVVSILKKLGITVYLCGRQIERIVARSIELDIQPWAAHFAVDLFVNATPASETPLEETPNFLEALQPCRIAFDHEMPGRYMKRYCEVHSIFAISGLDMYYPQMYAQWELFLQDYIDRAPPADLPRLLADAEER